MVELQDVNESVWRETMMTLQPWGTRVFRGSEMVKRNGGVSDPVKNTQNCVPEARTEGVLKREGVII